MLARRRRAAGAFGIMNQQISARAPGLSRVHLVFLALLIFGAAVRLSFFNSLTLDTQISVLPWFNQLAAAGFQGLGVDTVDAEGRTMGNYAPPYYYLLLAGTAFGGLLQPLWIIKLITVVFEALGAFFAFKIVRMRFSEERALFAAAIMLLAPTAIANSAWWGQCDMIWTSLLMGSFYFTERRKPMAAVAMFTIALALKAQAFFFAPYLFMLFVRGEIPWRAVLVAPVLFVLLMVPAVIAGQTWEHVLTVYARQGNRFDELAMNAPNLYYFFRYNLSVYATVVPIGLALTAIVSFVLAVLPRLRKTDLTPDARLLAAAMFLALSPFLLPKMHDRYFFAADMFTILLAFTIPRLWFVPVAMQISSLLSYLPIAIIMATGHMQSWSIPFAALLNTVTVSYLVYEYWRTCTRSGVQIAPTRPVIVAWATVILANVAWLSLGAWHAGALQSMCPASGLVDTLICQRDIPLDVKWGTWRHMLMYLAVFAASFVVVWFAVAQARKWPWAEWTAQLQAKLRSALLGRAPA